MINVKKCIIFFLILVTFITLSGCRDEKEDDPELILNQVSESLKIDEEISSAFLRLPKQIENISINWESSDENIISLDGVVNRPHYLVGDVTVILTAHLSLNELTKILTFEVLVKAIDVDYEEVISGVYDALTLSTIVFEDLDLPLEINNVKITWQSSNESILTNTGLIIHANLLSNNENVLMTATLSYGGIERSKIFHLVIPSYTKSYQKIEGFAGLLISETGLKRGDPGYYLVTNEKEFIKALTFTNDSKLGTVSAKVIEITNDLNMGYLDVINKYPDETFNSTIFRAHAVPKTHPDLIASGVSRITIQDRKAGTKYGEGLVIFSQTGVKVKRCSWIFKRSENIVVRNLEFDELWEYDDKGDYDSNDWDYITLEDINGAWLDHLTIGKAYDGLIDMKGKSENVSITWSKFLVTRSEFIELQIAYLEENIDSFPKYKILRNSGLTVDDIVEINCVQKKGHLVGATELNVNNDTLTITLAYNYYYSIQDRIPRLRGGDAHVYNIIHDASRIYELKQLYPSVNFTNQGLITTENGAVFMEESIFIGVETAIKNNQKTDSDDRFTGKYLVRNSIYELGSFIQLSSSTDGASVWRHANSATKKEFAFNNFENIPYHYQTVNVEQLKTYLTNNIVGTIDSGVDWLVYGGEEN